MGKPLTSELVLLRSKCDNLFSVKNLNLWGNEIDDVKLLRQMPNVEVLSLSLNKISSLKEFASCSKLQELYLRRNNVTDISEVRSLSHLQNLKILWLLDNPCSDIENYREIVIKFLPNLTKLDNTQITNEERISASKKTFNFMEENEPSETKTKQGLPLSEKRSTTNDYNSNKFPPQHQIAAMPVGFKKENSNVHMKEYDSNDFRGFQENPNANRSSFYQKNENILSALNNKKEHEPSELVQNMHENAIKQSSNNTVNKNENILCAVLALLKELDETSLELVRREIERKLSKMC